MIYFETGYVGDAYDLEHPRILWNSVTRRGTVTVSSETTGHEGVNAATATTHDTWKPEFAGAVWTLTFDMTETINAVAIDTHTIGSTGTTVHVQEWNGSNFVSIDSAAPSDDEPIAFLFTPRSTDRIRLWMVGGAPEVAVIHCSKALELPQRVYQGAPTPVDMALVTEFETNVSTGGRYLGRSIRQTKNKNDFQVRHLTEAYVRSTLFPFIKDAREYPYFLLERPQSRPDALSYRWRESDIRPERMGVLDLMQVSL